MMRDIERVIKEVNATMTIEGMPITSQDKTRIRTCAGNKELVNKKITELVFKHSVKATKNVDI